MCGAPYIFLCASSKNLCRSGTGGTFQSVTELQDFDGPISDGEILCEEIQMLLNDLRATPEHVSQKLDALRQARARGRQKWARAQKELRQVLNLRQQATLTMMGLLE